MWIIVIVVAVLLSIGGVVVWRIVDARSLPPVVAENADQKHKETQDAFEAVAIPLSDADETSRIKKCFDLLAAGVVQKDATKIADAFDFDRLYQELEREHALDGVSSRERDQIVPGLKKSFSQSIAQKVWALDRREIKRVKFSGDRREAVVYTRDFATDGTQQKTRFWVRRKGTAWRIYDLESLDGGLRVSTAMAAGMRVAISGGQTSSFQTLTSAFTYGTSGEYTKAEAALKSIETASFPPEFESLRGVVWASIHSSQKKIDLVLADCDKVEGTGRDVPKIHQLRAIAYNQLKQYDKALASAQEWKASLGGDLEVYYEMGLALAGLGRQQEAAAAFAQSLDDDPDALNSLKEFSKALPLARKKEVVERFTKCKRQKAAFAELAPILQKARALDAMESLIAAYKATGTEDAWADYYTGELQVIRKQFAEAEHTFLPLLKRVPGLNSVDLFNEEYVYAAMKAGHSLEGYANVADKRKGFRWLTGWMNTDTLDTPALRKLIELHRPGNENDPWLMLWQGDLQSLAGDYDAAEASYGGAAAGAAAEDQPRILGGRVQARFKAGKGLSAYTDLQPKRTVYMQLAKLYLKARDADELEKLVAARRADAPTDDLVPFYDAEVNYLRADYAGVVDVLTRSKRELVADETTRFRWRNLYVRSLVQVKRYDDALATANSDEADPPGESDEKAHHFYAALVHAAAGHVDQTAELLTKCLAEGYQLQEFYTDWIAGPALRSAPFAEWRKTHPDPAATPSTRPARAATTRGS